MKCTKVNQAQQTHREKVEVTSCWGAAQWNEIKVTQKEERRKSTYSPTRMNRWRWLLSFKLKMFENLKRKTRKINAKASTTFVSCKIMNHDVCAANTVASLLLGIHRCLVFIAAAVILILWPTTWILARSVDRETARTHTHTHDLVGNRQRGEEKLSHFSWHFSFSSSSRSLLPFLFLPSSYSVRSSPFQATERRIS